MIFCYRSSNRLRWVLGTMKSRVLKSRNITLLTQVCTVKAMIFPVFTYSCENWTIKKVECWRIDAFELWCWRRVLRAPWTARRSSQSTLKEISPEYSLEGLLLKLRSQYSGYLMQTANSLEKNPDAGKDWGQEEKGAAEDETVGWHHQLNGHELSKLRETVKDREVEVWHAAVHVVAKSWTQPSNWARTKKVRILF